MKYKIEFKKWIKRNNKDKIVSMIQSLILYYLQLINCQFLLKNNNNINKKSRNNNFKLNICLKVSDIRWENK